jgi:hypothetical protein
LPVTWFCGQPKSCLKHIYSMYFDTFSVVCNVVRVRDTKSTRIQEIKLDESLVLGVEK